MDQRNPGEVVEVGQLTAHLTRRSTPSTAAGDVARELPGLQTRLGYQLGTRVIEALTFPRHIAGSSTEEWLRGVEEKLGYTTLSIREFN